MASTFQRIGLSVVSGLVSGAVAYFTGEVLEWWGVLDPIAVAIGGALKVNVQSSDALNMVGLIVFVLLWGVLLYFIWRTKKSDIVDSAKPGQDSSETADRPQFLSLSDLIKLAGKAGWDVDPQSTRDSNNLWVFLTRLRQALSDGVITARGKLFRADWMTEDVDDTPLTQIPAEHFHTFSFDVFEIARGDNYRISTKPQSQTADNPVRGERYIDIQLNRVEAEKWLSGDGKPDQ